MICSLNDLPAGGSCNLADIAPYEETRRLRCCWSSLFEISLWVSGARIAQHCTVMRNETGEGPDVFNSLWSAVSLTVLDT